MAHISWQFPEVEGADIVRQPRVTASQTFDAASGGVVYFNPRYGCGLDANKAD
jgi:hypothetical protein